MPLQKQMSRMMRKKIRIQVQSQLPHPPSRPANWQHLLEHHWSAALREKAAAHKDDYEDKDQEPKPLVDAECGRTHLTHLPL
jgi:hypothetical protein